MEDLDKVVADALAENNIPYAAYAVTNAKDTIASGSVGFTDLEGKHALSSKAIFRIASMTKALTSTGFLWLADKEKLDLQMPVENLLEEFKDMQVAKLIDGKVSYSEPKTKVTFHHLLTHTSGFGYDFHHETLSHLLLKGEIVDLLDKEGKFLESPLIAEPGEEWHYGMGIGWIGKAIEKLSGSLLNDFMTENIFKPLELSDTSFDISVLGEDRLPNIYAKGEDDSLTDISGFMASPQIEEFAYGGGGIFSCPLDYVKFLRLFLNQGQVNGEEFLPKKVIDEMTINQIDNLSVPFQPTFNPGIISANEWFPGIEKKWGYGFMINTEDVPNARTKGSCAWSGIMNTFFWFDAEKDIGGTIMMQIAPCYHEKPKKVLQKFEEAIYRAL